MKRYRAFIIMAAIFVAASVLLYFVHYFVFRDTHHIFIYMLGDLAFLPLEVFLVVVVIERLLEQREKKVVLQKLNMVVGSFYSEVGNKLLHELLPCFVEKDDISRNLELGQKWSHNDFKKAFEKAQAMSGRPDCQRISLEELRTFLVQKRQFLLTLLENPTVLENEPFADLLMAVFHLTEELEARMSFSSLPKSDYAHLSNDIQRVYRHLSAEWVAYAEHLKQNYPYLFSLVIRMNPFKKHVSPVVLE